MRKWSWMLVLMVTLLAVVGCGDNGGDDDDDDDNVTPTPTATPDPNWEVLPSLTTERQEHPVLAFQGEVWMFGGFINVPPSTTATIEAFDPVANSWRGDITAPPQDMHHANVAIANNTVYIVGFLIGGAFTASGRVFEYDVAQNDWTEKTAMPLGTERGASQVGAIGDFIYVAGGYRGGTVADFSRYDVINDVWEPLTDAPVARDHGVGAAVQGKFYQIAGRSGGANSDLAYEYDPGTTNWNPVMSIPTARGGIAAAVHNDKIYVLGGELLGGGGVFDANEVYDPLANTWDTMPPMANPRHGMGAAAVGDKIYFPGGGITDGFGATDYFDAFIIPSN